MENIIKQNKEEILAEVKSTGIVRAHHLSPAAVNVINSYYQEDLDESDIDNFLAETHLLAYLKLILETSKKYRKNDLEIINLVYENPVETLKVNNGYVDLFADRSMLHRREKFSSTYYRADPTSLDSYVHNNIKIITAAHDAQYLNPDTLTEADRNEIRLASLSCYRFHYESDLRTVSFIKGNPDKLRFIRTLTLKRTKSVYYKMVRDSSEKLDITHFSEYGEEIIRQIAAQNQYKDRNKFLQIQSNLHLLERKFLKYSKEPKPAEEIEPLKKDLESTQAFKEASVDIEQIIFPKAEILICSDESVLFAPEGEEPESHVDIYQFIMTRLNYLQDVYFHHEWDSWGEPDPDSVSFQFRKYGIDFDIVDGRVITIFTQEFKDRLFKSANVRLA